MTICLLVINPKKTTNIDSIKEYISTNKDMYDKVVIAPHQMQLNYVGEEKLKKEFFANEVVPINKFAVDSTNLEAENTVYDICGYDINYEVLATCFALADKGYKFRILSNFIYTSKDQDNKLPPNILLRCFSYSVI